MIRPEHLQEWLDSCVNEGIIRLNARSLWGDAPYEYLFYSDKIQRTNTGRVSSGLIRKYAHLERGGWWSAGLDPQGWDEMLWGCFKPDHARRADDGKIIKYEHPLKTPTRAFFLQVPLDVWQRIAKRYQVPLPENITTTKAGEAVGFWSWVLAHPKIPITLVEGVKKAGAVLTTGYVAIGLPGITSGYRVFSDENGNPTGGRALIPDLQLFTNSEREIYICFDHETKQNTIRAVNNAIATMGNLFEQKSCRVRNIMWTQPAKGIDDLIAVYGEEAFDRAYQDAPTLDIWKARRFSQLTYPAALTVNRRYFGQVSIPDDAKLVCIKGAKGTGKTEVLESIVADAIASGQWVLVIGHRVQLVEALCQRFGIPYVTEVRTSDTGKTLGYGLCVDSLHPNSQARFSADNWRDGVVIIDECEQVLWHGLNSSTCQSDRVSILRQLKTLLGNVLQQGNGRVFLADADLSDISIDFVQALAGVALDPWVLLNEWQPGDDERWDIHNYTGNDPSGLVAELEAHIRDGGRPLVCCSAQKAKSKWGTRNLEAHLRQQFPDKRILRIDSESIADPSHPAYGAIAKLNQLLANYDIVICSPSVETGLSIDLKRHFTSVWGIFQGVQSESSARQALSRLRESVPRHIWAASYGIGRVGNGSTSVKSLLASQHKLTKANVRLLVRIVQSK